MGYKIVVYDGIGKDQTENNVNVEAKHGTLVAYSAAVGGIPTIIFLRVVSSTDVNKSGIRPLISPAKLTTKNIKFVGPGESSLMRCVGTPQEFEKWCAKLFDTITKGRVNVRIHDMYALSEIVRVHKYLEGRKTTGEVLVKP